MHSSEQGFLTSDEAGHPDSTNTSSAEAVVCAEAICSACEVLCNGKFQKSHGKHLHSSTSYRYSKANSCNLINTNVCVYQSSFRKSRHHRIGATTPTSPKPPQEEQGSKANQNTQHEKAEIATVPMVAAASPLILGTVESPCKPMVVWGSSEISTLSGVAVPGCSSEHLDLFVDHSIFQVCRATFIKDSITIKTKALTKFLRLLLATSDIGSSSSVPELSCIDLRSSSQLH